MAQKIALMILASGIGIPAAFFTIALPGMMRDGGASLMQVGLVYLVWLPSVVKVLWAPLVERFAVSYRSRRRIISLTTLVMGLGFLPVSWLAVEMAVGWLLALAVLSAALGLTLQLVIAGWCMSSLDEAARGRANGLIAAGMVLGGILGGGAVPSLAGIFGWLPVVCTLSVFIALTGLAGRFLQTGASVPVADQVRLRDALRIFAGTKGGLLLGAVALIASTGAVDMTLAARLVDAGLSPERAAFVLGTFATILMVPATLLAGQAISRWHPARCFAAVCMVKAVVLFALAFLPQASVHVIAGLAVAEFICAGALTVLTWQFYMSRPDRGAEISGFAILTSVDALFRLGFGIAAGALGTVIGMSALFGGVAGLNLIAACFLLMIWQKVRRQDQHPPIDEFALRQG
ncbi:MAG: MFS transporter [Pseudomonadota bacterium]